MKKGYLLIYALVILSLLSLLVIGLTDRATESSHTSSAIDRLIDRKYDFESAGHKILSEYSYEELEKIYNDLAKIGNGKNYKVNIDYSPLNEENAFFYRDGDSLNFQIGDQYSDYRLRASLELEKYLNKNDSLESLKSDRILAILNKELKDGINPYIEINNTILRQKSDGYYKEVVDESNTEISDRDKISEDYSNNLEGEITDIDYIDEGSDIEKSNLDREENIELKDKKDIKTDQDDGNSNDIIDNIDQIEIEGNNKYNFESETNKEDTSNIDINIEEKLTYYPNYDRLWLGPNIRYEGNDFKSYGLMEIDEQTIFAGRVVHSGIAIIKGRPKINNGKLIVKGGIINEDEIALDFLEFREWIEPVNNLLSRHKVDGEFRVQSFTIEWG